MTYSTTEGPHRKKVRPFIYQGGQARKLLMLQSPGVWLCSSARTPLPYRLPLARPSPARSHSSLPTCATIAGLRACGISSGAWNIEVRTRGVFTHRDDFLEPACVERGLVRTGISPISNSRCELVLAILLPPGQPPSPTVASAASASARCEPVLQKPLPPGQPPCHSCVCAIRLCQV